MNYVPSFLHTDWTWIDLESDWSQMSSRKSPFCTARVLWHSVAFPQGAELSTFPPPPRAERLAQCYWATLTHPRPIFSAPAEGAFCLFIYLLEMNKRYQEPSVRICKCPSHLQTCEMHNESGDDNNNARQYHWKQALLMQPQCTEKYHPVALLVPNEFVCVLIKSSTSTCSILLFMDHV